MNKRKIVGVTVFFEDGEAIQFNEPGTFSESINARKKGGFTNLQEWAEYHITWIVYVKKAEPPVETVEKADREQLRGRAWCSQHGMEPGDCFAKHNPTAYSGRQSQWDDVKAVSRRELPKAFKEQSIWPEFDLKDLLEGYGNGNGQSHL